MQKGGIPFEVRKHSCADGRDHRRTQLGLDRPVFVRSGRMALRQHDTVLQIGLRPCGHQRSLSVRFLQTVAERSCGIKQKETVFCRTRSFAVILKISYLNAQKEGENFVTNDVKVFRKNG